MIGTPSETLSQQALHPPRGESLSSSSTTTTTNKEPEIGGGGGHDCPTPTPSLAQSGSSTIVAGGGGGSLASIATGSSSTIGGGGGHHVHHHGHHPTSFMAHSMSLQQQQSWKVQQPRLRFVSSVEFRHSSGETSTTPLSPESPIDDSSAGEATTGGSRPSRLQRSKAQSRKTFRLRRGRQNHGEVFFKEFFFS